MRTYVDPQVLISADTYSAVYFLDHRSTFAYVCLEILRYFSGHEVITKMTRGELQQAITELDAV